MRTLTISRASGRSIAGKHVDDGPAYPDLGAKVAKLRKAPRTAANTALLGDAICEAVRARQRSALMKVLTPISCPCASGTWHSDGAKILAAVNRNNLAALDRATADDHRRRSDEQVGKALAAALAGRESPLVANIWGRP